MEKQFDYLIIGAGPAGLQMGYYLHQAGEEYLILESGESAGTFFKSFPRHRTLISINKVYTGYDDPEVNLRWDWNSLLSDNNEVLFKDYAKEYFPKADTLVKYLAGFAEHFNLKVQYNTRVAHVSKDEGFKLTTEQGDVYRCKRLIVATGFTQPYTCPIPGIELAENYYDVSVDPEEFANKKVLIVGKGNSAFETADNLVSTAAVIHLISPQPLKMAWKTHFVGHLRAINNNILDTYQLKSQNALLDATIQGIRKEGDKLIVSLSYAHANGEQEELAYDRVIACTGFRFDPSIFDETCRPNLTINDRFPEQTSEWESTNVKDLYFVGTLTQMRDFKKTTSGFIHGFRYNVRALYRILRSKYNMEEWPQRRIDLTAENLMEAVIDRVNKTSALWQQFGFLCDLIIVSEEDKEARYYEEVPTDYVRDGGFGQNEHYYTVTLEYGDAHAFEDPFNVTRIARDDVEKSQESNFLHPIVRRFSGDKMIAEHHIIEDLAAEWLEDVHIKPLLKFFEEELRSEESAALV
jgi:thioredoxin reductase